MAVNARQDRPIYPTTQMHTHRSVTEIHFHLAKHFVPTCTTSLATLYSFSLRTCCVVLISQLDLMCPSASNNRVSSPSTRMGSDSMKWHLFLISPFSFFFFFFYRSTDEGLLLRRARRFCRMSERILSRRNDDQSTRASTLLTVILFYLALTCHASSISVAAKTVTCIMTISGQL
jgi:hypothetical protein